ncbi:cation diffusion facilitator family transporter [Methanocaldococcus indicus]|uniref:cation diffusion facilitator family transporter n=1 Tax=Methanocaldococcus indicus TaxID=213231 RepID=UPI003C6D38CF
MEELKKPLIVSIFGNIVLSVIKIFVGYIYNSISLISDGFHSLSDVITSIIGYYGIKISQMPEDENHPYGHSRFETLFSLIIGLALLLTGFELLKMSIDKIINIGTVEVNAIVLGVAILSIIIKELMTQYSLYIGRKYNNSILIADAYHHRSDVLSTIVVLVGLILEKFGFIYGDGLAGVIVSLMVAKAAIDICKDSIDKLTGKSPSNEILNKIKETVLKIDGVKGYHDLKAHYVGPDIFVEIHVEVDKDLSAKELHDLETKITKEIENIKGIKRAYVHLDPI